MYKFDEIIYYLFRLFKNNNKLSYYILASILMLMVLTSSNHVAFADNMVITKDELSSFLSGDDKIKLESKNSIAKKVLHDTNKELLFGNGDNITLNFIDGKFRKKNVVDKIFIVGCGNNNTIVALYESKLCGFKYISIVDTFFNLEDYQIVNIKSLEIDILLLREKIDQTVGAFETSTYLKAYLYNGDQFEIVLNVLEDYMAFWNELWQTKEEKIVGSYSWLMIKERSWVVFDNKSHSNFVVNKKQEFGKSVLKNSIEFPGENNFYLIKNREFKETYYWSNNWKSFILYQGKRIDTGEIVAVIEDLSNSPFDLFEEKPFKQTNFRIMTRNGQVEIINKNEIIIYPNYNFD